MRRERRQPDSWPSFGQNSLALCYRGPFGLTTRLRAGARKEPISNSARQRLSDRGANLVKASRCSMSAHRKAIRDRHKRQAGYRASTSTHYSLTFLQVVSESPQTTGERCHLYLKRDVQAGRSIIDRIITETRDSQTLKRARVKVTLVSGRYRDGEQWDHLELLDVQFVKDNGDDWGPWLVESIQKQERDVAAAAEVAAAKATETRQKQLEEERLKREAERRASLTRVWSDSSGKFSVKAEFAGLIGGKVKLLRPDGAAITVELEKLSKTDRDWIRSRK